MAATGASRQPSDNRLLAALPPVDFRRLLAALQPFPLQARQVLHEDGDLLRYVYFPCSGMVSLLRGANGTVEVGSIGRAGVIGLPVLWGVRRTLGRALVQVPGNAVRLEVAAFEEEIHRRGALYRLVCRYTHAFVVQLMQSVACNGLHSVRQRYCRWLLMTQDEIAADTFPFTQQFLAQMLGVRRASVAEVAHELQGKGLIRYARGHITIRNRCALEAAACPCYRIIKHEYEHLFE
jgi:CRP-like cAMP-binding protein